MLPPHLGRADIDGKEPKKREAPIHAALVPS
jgi:hypothetical protein